MTNRKIYKPLKCLKPMINYKLMEYSRKYGASETIVQNIFNESPQKVYAEAILNKKIPFLYPEKSLDNLCLKLTKQKLEKRKN